MTETTCCPLGLDKFAHAPLRLPEACRTACPLANSVAGANGFQPQLVSLNAAAKQMGLSRHTVILASNKSWVFTLRVEVGKGARNPRDKVFPNCALDAYRAYLSDQYARGVRPGTPPRSMRGPDYVALNEYLKKYPALRAKRQKEREAARRNARSVAQHLLPGPIRPRVEAMLRKNPYGNLNRVALEHGVSRAYVYFIRKQMMQKTQQEPSP